MKAKKGIKSNPQKKPSLKDILNFFDFERRNINSTILETRERKTIVLYENFTKPLAFSFSLFEM
jgi:hypothetical protein